MPDDDAMKRNIESALAETGINPALAAATFSRGWFFSRQAQADAAEQLILPALRMDDDKFRDFADRLNQMVDIAKKIKEPPSSE